MSANIQPDLTFPGWSSSVQTMTSEELRLAAHLLDMAADTYSNFGCNDFDTASLLSLEARDSLSAEVYADDPDYSPQYTGGPDYRIMDWHAMRLIADRLRQEADKPA